MLEGSGERACGRCKGEGSIRNWLWFRKLCDVCKGKGYLRLVWGSRPSQGFDVQHPPDCPAKCFWSEAAHGMYCPQGGCKGIRLTDLTTSELAAVNASSVTMDMMVAEGFAAMSAYLHKLEGAPPTVEIPDDDFLVVCARANTVYVTTKEETTEALVWRLAALRRHGMRSPAEVLSITYALHMHYL